MKVFSWLLMMNLLIPLSFAKMEGGERLGKHGEHLKKELNLSDEQMARIKEIRQEHHKDLKAAKEKFKAAKTDFKTSMGNSQTSNEELEQKFTTFQTARNEFQTKRFQMMMAMRSILKPEQVAKSQEMRKKWKAKKHKFGKRSKEE